MFASQNYSSFNSSQSFFSSLPTASSVPASFACPASPMVEAPVSSSISLSGPKSHTQSPIVTGSSVLAVKYKDGVMLMADTCGSYGNMGMFKHITRLHPVNATTLIGGGGEHSDMQYMLKLLEQLRIQDFAADDGITITPKQIHSYVGRVMYNRRSKVDPLWNQIITAGYYQDKSFLGMVDLYGTMWEGDVLATGFGLHLAMPLLRKHARTDMSYDEAKKLLVDCMRVLFYRDCKSINSFQLATLTRDGTNISSPFSVDTNWEMKRQISPQSAE